MVEIISVVSGKGGVGKTMLSVAFGSELSRGTKTLLFDLDFFNRGLTGLFASLAAASPRKRIATPTMLIQNSPTPSTEPESESWFLAEVSQNLFTIHYDDDFDKSLSGALEAMGIEELSKLLLAYVQYVADQAGCEFVILDCHGGPDITSFAACFIASRTIVVSEPDRITLHGTLNFLRSLKRHSQKDCDLRLVFNKVIPAYTSIFLFRFYDQYLREEFQGRDLLAIYPLEIYLTKAFEKTPILTTVYPRSQLAIKTQLSLHELFKQTPEILPPHLRNMNFISLLYRKYSLGRWPTLLNTDFIFKVIGVFVATVVGIYLASTRSAFILEIVKSFNNNVDPFESTSKFEPGPAFLVFTLILVLLFFWVCLAIFLKWMRELDVVLTYSFRTRRYLSATGACLLLVLFSLGTAYLLGDFHVKPRLTDLLTDLPVFFVGTVLVLRYAWQGWQDIKIDRRYIEGGFRIALSLGAVCATVLRSSSS